MKRYFEKFITEVNNKKKIFTPGPASFLKENLTSMGPCFGRGDKEYIEIENKVLKNILSISGHKNIARLQGAASLALEIMISNFVYGKVLIINTGVYSDRLLYMANSSKRKYGYIKKIQYVKHDNLENIKKKFDWIIACPVETSIGYKIPINDLYKLKMICKSKLALDATASIGLEEDHYLSDISAFSSCKGLFGLTGGAFVCFNKKPNNKVDEFNLNIYSHLEKKMTGPYHAIYSLHDVLKNHEDFSYAVKINKKIFMKKMKNFMYYNEYNQPNLCTLINKKITTKNKNVILYETRAKIKGSVLCHLGEVHLKRKAKGNILKYLKI